MPSVTSPKVYDNKFGYSWHTFVQYFPVLTWRHGSRFGVQNNSEKSVLLLCKTWGIFCHCFVHQHGRLITWVKRFVSKKKEEKTIVINHQKFPEIITRRVSGRTLSVNCICLNENFLPHDFLVIDEVEAFISEAVSTRPYIISEVWRFFESRRYFANI